MDVLDPDNLKALLPYLTAEEKTYFYKELKALEDLREQEEAQSEFMTFVRRVWPGFIHGRHHEKVARVFEKIAAGTCKRLIISMPPRHTKSEFTSYLLPAWFLGKFPDKKIIQASNTAELAVGFGRKVRNLVDSAEYKAIFPELELRADSKAAGRWDTNKGGSYFAIGVGGIMTGRGADLMIIDDPHDEGEAVLAESDPTIYDKVYDWYTSGPRQRLQPDGIMCIIMTRWSKRDLVARVIDAAAKRGPEALAEWEVIELPAIMPDGTALWPEYWPLEKLLPLKEELPAGKWAAQYMQQPTGESTAIIKRTWWREWEGNAPPHCDYILTSWDTAHEAHNRADYSACTTWGVFTKDGPDGRSVQNIILLDAMRDRLEFPQLKRWVLDEYKKWKPDGLIIEKKASGAPLIQELRAMGVPAQEFTPTRGNDKIVRLNAIADVFSSGMVWAPSTKWAEEVIEEVASFPSGDHDDFVDTVSMALARFRQGGFVKTTLDLEDEPRSFRSRKRRQGYY